MWAAFPVPVLSAALEILMNIPKDFGISIPYVEDRHWVNFELRNPEVRDQWSEQLCRKYMDVTQKENWVNQSHETLLTDRLRVGGDKESFEYIVASFLQYCATDLYDSNREVISADDSKMYYIYAKAYLKWLSLMFEVQHLNQWGQVGRIIAHFVHMAATGAYKHALPHKGFNPGQTWKIPDIFRQPFGFVNYDDYVEEAYNPSYDWP